MSESTADLWDARSEELMSCDVQFRSYGAHQSFDGPVRTVRCHEDNQLVKRLLNSPGRGSVLVVDGGGSLRSALVGDQIGAAAVANGWAGIVIYGAVRDSDALSGLDLGIKALGTNPRRSSKTGEGSVDEAVSFGGATFVPGVHLWADADGIVVEVG
ncbi:MAG: ribonuclease E activity regulator RraA [Acidimicrobiia bacterium]